VGTCCNPDRSVSGYPQERPAASARDLKQELIGLLPPVLELVRKVSRNITKPLVIGYAPQALLG